MTSPRQLAALTTLSLPLILLAGCGSNSTAGPINPPHPPAVEPNNCKSNHINSPIPPPPSHAAQSTFTGVVLAGRQPVVGATVTLYAAGTTGNGSIPTTLVFTPITTDANGNFTVPAGYVCPNGDSVLYVIARGGAVSGHQNTGITLAAILGPCGSLASTLTINELTTVATAYGLAQFISGENIGASSTNAGGLLLAAATATNLVNPATGTAPGTAFPATGTAPIAKLNSLAALLNTCTGSATSSTDCISLYDATGNASDTFAAALNIVRQPGTNVAALYSQSATSSAYSPALTSAPADWTLAVNFAGGGLNAPSAVSIDSTGKLWVSNYYAVASVFTNTGEPLFPNGIGGDGLDNSYGGAVNVDDNFWDLNEETSSTNNGLGSISVLNTTGLVATYTAGGIDFPLGIAFDTSGVGWVVDYGNSTVALLDSNGTPLSGPIGYSSTSLQFPVAVATDAKCNAYLANQSSNTLTRVLADGSEFTDYVVGDGPSGVAIDAGGNIWSANYYGDSIGLVSSSGTILSGAGYKGGGIEHPQGIAADGSGNIWVANYLNTALSELAGVSSATSAPASGTILSPPSGWAPDSGLAKPFGLAIDAAGNIWITNFGSSLLTEFVGLATPVQTPLLGPVRIP